MDENISLTLSYYDKNASSFLSSTADAEMGALQAAFISMLPKGARVLDLGCGSGRDSLVFLRAGLEVDAMDGSVEMVRAARELTGLPVTHALFADFESEREYDGIWACSSLLHVPSGELREIIEKYAEALKAGGVFYLSFKLGTHEGMRNGRWFTDMTETAFRQLVEAIDGLEVEKIDVTSDVRPGRSHEKWLNAWCRRAEKGA